MAGGNWTPSVEKIRAGVYVNFIAQAQARLSGGKQGTVAIGLLDYEGTAVANTIYEFNAVDGITEVKSTLGITGAKPVELAFAGGASKVIVYTVGKTEELYDIDKALVGLSTRSFNAFVFSDVVSTLSQTTTLAWIKSNREEVGKHFFGIFGGSSTDDLNISIGNTRSTTLKDLYSINLVTGGAIAGEDYSSAQLTPYLAGMITGSPINQGITYATTALETVNVRLTPTQIISGIEKGSLMFSDNENGTIIVERGITTNVGSVIAGSNKIRKTRTNMIIASDITKTANANWVGKINNTPDGQATVIGAVHAYLLEMVRNEVLFAEPLEVSLDTNYQSTGDKMYLYVRYVEVDSAEEFYFTIEAGA